MTKKITTNYRISSHDDREQIVNIPISLLKDRALSVLEILVEFLKDDLHYTYHEIAELTNRDDRTIWTVYQRAKKKRIINNK